MPTYNISSYTTLNSPNTSATGADTIVINGTGVEANGVNLRLRLTTDPNYYRNVYRRLTFNANTDVNSGTDFISYPNHPFATSDIVVYYVENGNTVLGGLTSLQQYAIGDANTSGFKLYTSGSPVNITANTTDTGANTSGHVIQEAVDVDSIGQFQIHLPTYSGNVYIGDPFFGHHHTANDTPYTSASYSWEIILTNENVANGTAQSINVVPFTPSLLGNDPNDYTWSVVELTTKPPNTSIFYLSNGTFTQSNTGDQIEFLSKDGAYYPNTLPTWTIDSNNFISSGPANLHINFSNVYWRYWSSTQNVWSDFMFANVGTGSISGFVFDDTDLDGIFDVAESGRANVLVTVSGTSSANQRTHANGYYKFNLSNGTYDVTVSLPSGYTNTTVTVHSGLVLNNAIALTKSDLTGKNFGLKPATYAISGNVYVDSAQNGVQDVGDAAKLGATVTLTGDASSSTTTASNGYYVFTGLLAGNYDVTLTLPAGFTNTNPRILNETITSANLTGQGFGIWYLPANVGGNVFIDSDLDGVFDVGEPGKESVKLDLYYIADLGTSISNTTSAANGYYQFSTLAGNSYLITATLPSGYTNTSALSRSFSMVGIDVVRNFGLTPTMWPLSGRVFIDANENGVDNTDDPYEGATITLSGTSSGSNTTIANGYYSFLLANGTYTVTLTVPGGYHNTNPSILSGITIAGADSGDHSFGIHVDGNKLSGHVYLDVDEDGVNDAEAGFQDVQIALTGTSTGVVNSAANGYFSFDVTNGTYTLTVNAYPTGMHLTSPSAITGISVSANVPDQDFGIWYDEMTISGHVFEDIDIDGVMDGGESGIASVEMHLTGDATDATTTAANGYYEFTGLIPGTYSIMQTQPDGYDSTTPNFINGIVLTTANSTGNDFGEIAIEDDAPPTPAGIFLTKYVNPFANGDIVSYTVDYREINSVSGVSSNFITVANNDLANDVSVVYWRTNTNITPIGGLTPNTKYYVINSNTSGFKLAATVAGAVLTLTPPSGISNTIQIVNGGRGYDSTVNNQLIFTGGNTYAIGSGSVLPIATYANNANGTIVTITITGSGSGYSGHPTLSVNSAATSNVSNAAILVAKLDRGAGHQLLTKTPVAGLEHFGRYYVVNTTPKYIKLSATYPGTPIDITAASTQENGHYIRRLDEDQT